MEIFNFRPSGETLPGGSTLLAVFDVQLGGTPIRLHHLQLRKYPDGALRIMSPMTRVHGQEGRVRSYSLGSEITGPLVRSALQQLEVLDATSSTVRAA